MSKLLMYGDASHDVNGWGNAAEFRGDNIDKLIKDPTNTTSDKARNPRTSIPSPFARFELVQKAFAAIAKNNENADSRDKLLASNALDALQLYYEGSEQTEIVVWDKESALKELSGSYRNGHKHLAEALDLYMRNEDFGFNEDAQYTEGSGRLDSFKLYILTHNREPIAITSPTSVFLATSEYQQISNKLTIDGGKPLFGQIRSSLLDRDESFVLYLYRQMLVWRLLTKNTNILAPLKSFDDFLENQLKVLKERKPLLHAELLKIRNPLAQDSLSIDELIQDYEKAGDSGNYGCNVEVLGLPVYIRRKENIREEVANTSDFVINSQKTEDKPLVLTNAHTSSGWSYTSKNDVWGSKSGHSIDYVLRRNVKRTQLPGADMDYEGGWLCEHDFLSDVLIELPAPLSSNYFNGNLTFSGVENSRNIGFALPVLPKFFEYFDLEYLMGSNGRDPNFKMTVRKTPSRSQHPGTNPMEVLASLKIPVKNGASQRYITLKKTYRYPDDNSQDYPFKAFANNPNDNKEALGFIAKSNFELSILPFVRMSRDEDNNYIVQMMRVLLDSTIKVNLEAYKDNTNDGIHHYKKVLWKDQAENDNNFLGSVREGSSDSSYYCLKTRFDYLMAHFQVLAERNDYALFVPLLQEYRGGNKKLRFGFDFGTSNSHIAVREADGNELFLDFKIDKSIGSTLSEIFETSKHQTSGPVDYMFKICSQEFIPKEGLGETYKFPNATALLRSRSMSESIIPKALRDVNIPFIYGMENYNETYQMIESNLKWVDDNESRTKFAKAYIEELVILARAFAIQQGANLKECTFAWTFPLSMNRHEVSDFEDFWNKLYREYFSNQEDSQNSKVACISESVAPLLYYVDQEKAVEEFNLLIDIGGGTCDVVLYQDSSTQYVTSFRFGANAIFGVGNISTVSMINNGLETFIQKLEDILGKNDSIPQELRNLKGKTQTPAEEVNNRLFGLENIKKLRNRDIEDKSYNLWLKNQKKYKLIFVYYYAAIIYHLTKLIIANGFKNKPKAIFFSGTGSKLLHIIGNNSILEELTSKLIEKFSENKFSYSKTNLISINIEREQPKQITAMGTLYKENRAKTLAQNARDPHELKLNSSYSFVNSEDESKNSLKYSDLLNHDIIDNIIKNVKEFNGLFYEFMNQNDLLRINEESLESFKNTFVEDEAELLTYYQTIQQKQISKDTFSKHADEPFEDAPFFFAVKGIIMNLLNDQKQ